MNRTPHQRTASAEGCTAATHHVEGIVGGWHDSQLTPAGVRAAASVARALRARIPNGAEVELLSSDLQRTRRTAENRAIRGEADT